MPNDGEFLQAYKNVLEIARADPIPERLQLLEAIGSSDWAEVDTNTINRPTTLARWQAFRTIERKSIENDVFIPKWIIVSLAEAVLSPDPKWNENAQRIIDRFLVITPNAPPSPKKMQPNISAWVTFSSPLSDLELLSLLGLLVSEPSATPDSIDTKRLVSEENCTKASTWLTDQFRTVLRRYCDFERTLASTLPIKTKHAEVFVVLAPSLVSQLGIPTGIVVSVLTFLLRGLVTEWCHKYGMRKLSGEGHYRCCQVQNVDEAFDPDNERKIAGTFALNYSPAIDEKISDCKIRTSGGKIFIVKEAEAEGIFTPSRPEDYNDSRAGCLEGGRYHEFSFTDSDSQTFFTGEVDFAKTVFREAEIRVHALSVKEATRE